MLEDTDTTKEALLPGGHQRNNTASQSGSEGESASLKKKSRAKLAIVAVIIVYCVLLSALTWRSWRSKDDDDSDHSVVIDNDDGATCSLHACPQTSSAPSSTYDSQTGFTNYTGWGQSSCCNICPEGEEINCNLPSASAEELKLSTFLNPNHSKG